MTMAKGPLRIGANGVRKRCRNQSKGRHQHGHHDGAKPQDGAFDGGIHDGVAASPELVDVFQHDDAGLDRHPEERQETDAGGHAEVRTGEQQRQQPANARHGHVQQE